MRATSIAILVLFSFASEIMCGSRRPASFRRPIRSAISCAFWISSAMFTNFSCVSWKPAIGRPNWVRPCA